MIHCGSQGIINDSNSFSRIISFHFILGSFYSIFIFHTDRHACKQARTFDSGREKENLCWLISAGYGLSFMRVQRVHCSPVFSIIDIIFYIWLDVKSIFPSSSSCSSLYMMSAIHGVRLNQYIQCIIMYIIIHIMYTILLYGLLLFFIHSCVFVFVFRCRRRLILHDFYRVLLLSGLFKIK